MRTAAEGIVTGTSWYHLYFLLVTMQVYLLLPVIVWLVRRTRGHHVTVLVVAFLVQLVVFAGYKYFPASDAWMQGYQKQFFFSYVFFIVSGAIAADHADAFLRFIRVHRRSVLWAFAGVGGLTLGVWALQVGLGQSPLRRGDTAAADPGGLEHRGVRRVPGDRRRLGGPPAPRQPHRPVRRLRVRSLVRHLPEPPARDLDPALRRQLARGGRADGRG